MIYQDTFSGTAGVDLGGTTPSGTGGGSWITANSRANGGTDSGAALVFEADGTINKDGPNTTHDAGALLPFTMQANRIYTLEASIFNPYNNWVALGFASASAQLVGSNARHSNGNSAVFGGYGWGLTRDNNGGNLNNLNDQTFYNGIGTGNVSAAGLFGDPLAQVDLKIVVDTSDPLVLSTEYFVNGVLRDTGTLGAAAFGNISFVGISSDGSNVVGSSTATISNSSLTSVPEPGSFAILGAGLVGLAGFRRRR